MWCHNCEQISFAKKSTIRLTEDGHEIIVQICGSCNRKSETEYYKGPTIRITARTPRKKKKVTKRVLKKNLVIKVKKKSARSKKKASLGN